MKSKKQRLRVRISMVVGFLFFCLALLSESRWGGDSFLGTVLCIVGLLLAAVAVNGRLWCSLYIAGNKSKQLVCQGPYSMIRNPLYVFSMIGFVGVALCSKTLVLPLIAVMAFCLYYPSVIRDEERKLQSLFGEQFSQYMKSVPRFIPNLFLLKEPSTYEVNPMVFRRHLIESLAFILCAVLFIMLNKIHDLHWIPVYIHLY